MQVPVPLADRRRPKNRETVPGRRLDGSQAHCIPRRPGRERSLRPPRETVADGSARGGCLMLPKFYPILDTEVSLRRGVEPVVAAEHILEAGAKILQFRHKRFLSREAFGWLERIAELARTAGATLVVNDRADLAKLFGAALHLGQDDLPPSAARHVVGPDAIVGFSTHNEAQLRAALAEPV